MSDSQSNLEKEIISFIKEKWFSPLGLSALLILESLFFFPYFWINFGKGFNIYEWIILIIIFLVSFVIWKITTSCPKNIKNKIGIIIAITTESKKEHIKLKSDLISQFNKTIKNRSIENIFNVIELPEYYAVNVKDYSSSLKTLEKSNAHFIIYGICKKRLEKGKEHYFIVSEATAVYKSTSKTIKTTIDKLSKEFSELFPRKIIFPVEKEISGFEITKSWMGFVTRYIIGIAAFLSGDFYLSLNLFEKLYEEFKSIETNIIQIRKIKTRIPQRIAESALALASRNYFKYRKTKKKLFLDEMKSFLDILKRTDPNNYDAHLLRGIYLFLVERNIEEAIKEIKCSKNNSDITWKYNEAFLYAYKGNLEKAEKYYKKAFQAEVDPNIKFQTEEFIYDVLEIEPEKYQLWYCLGMINWKAKGDNILAKDTFKKFLKYKNDELFLKQKRKVKEYLKQL